MASHFLGLAWLRIAVAPVSMALPLVALLGGLALGQKTERYADIPADSIVVASVDFRELKDSAQFRMWPWEVHKVACQEQLGFEIEDI